MLRFANGENRVLGMLGFGNAGISIGNVDLSIKERVNTVLCVK